MHRFYIEPAQSQKPVITLSERESHHAVKVLRIREGERVVVLDGVGLELLCEVQQAEAESVSLKVYQKNNIPPLPYQLTLVQAIPKGKNMDIIVQKATELGTHRIIPIVSDRTVSQIEEESASGKLEKWNAIAVESIKQCGSAWIPKIELPTTPNAYLGSGDRAEIAFIATLQSDARHPRTFIREFQAEKKRLPKSIYIWIGPEGDFTPAEINSIRNAGALPISLGQLVLRSETAAIYALSVLNYELQAPA
ncbi:MAG: RsmE family RNA methyltransferase [Verrucomicrobiota bacterium]|nr:RsmE family RNA methyltransferase [Verrucomicrobiota bacterium]